MQALHQALNIRMLPKTTSIFLGEDGGILCGERQLLQKSFFNSLRCRRKPLGSGGRGIRLSPGLKIRRAPRVSKWDKKEMIELPRTAVQ